jgi:4-amino-4-deoxychorismate lyase
MLGPVKKITDSEGVPQILVNGKATDGLSVLDRGLQYGDGLFETFRIHDELPQFWDRHIFRLARGCERLRLPAPPLEQLTDEARQLCEGRQSGVLKIIVTRGGGGRGYGPPGEVHPSRIVVRFPAPNYPESYSRQGVAVRICDTRLGINPALAGLKHLNRLEQVLARAEWRDPAIHEGLMCDTEGRVVEGTMSNVFAVRDGRLLTPELSRCGVAGIMREVVLELAAKNAIPVQECSLEVEYLMSSQEVFLTNSLIGIWPVRRLADCAFAVGPVTQRLAAALEGEYA